LGIRRATPAPCGLVRDPVIAAIAESAGMVVLHDDRHFDLIAELSGQRGERLGQ
jgi:predicted nucleic acid-binding protein